MLIAGLSSAVLAGGIRTRAEGLPSMDESDEFLQSPPLPPHSRPHRPPRAARPGQDFITYRSFLYRKVLGWFRCFCTSCGVENGMTGLSAHLSLIPGAGVSPDTCNQPFSAPKSRGDKAVSRGRATRTVTSGACHPPQLYLPAPTPPLQARHGSYEELTKGL